MTSAGLEVREAGRALRVQTEAPHLVSMGSGRLSTAITLHPLPEGRIILGSSRDCDVIISGVGVEAVHCSITNSNGIVTLHPINGLTSIDNSLVTNSVRLTQGCILTIGSTPFRFNHPAEAQHLKSFLPMTPPNDPNTSHLEHKPPPAPRRSPRNSAEYDEGFLGKLNKFEMLARQSSRSYVSPKVFPVGSLTANVPADQIFGHSRSPSLASLTKNPPTSPFQNVTNLDRSRSTTPSTSCTPSNLAKSTSKTSKTPHFNDENNDYDFMSRSLTQNGTLDYFCEMDMSQSLIVAKTTTTEFLQLNSNSKFDSNPNLAGVGQCGSRVILNGSNTCGRRMKAPSPAFNRNPRYVEQKKASSKSPIGSNACSLEELRERQVDAENKRRMAENRRRQAHEDRVKEQEMERQEKIRLEEILAMCAEYEKQSTVEKPRQPNRIITNGSLPRDKRPGYNSPFGSPKSSPNQPQFIFDPQKSHQLQNNNNNNNNNNSNYYNADLSPNNNNRFCNSLPRMRKSNYENVRTEKTANGNISFYENVAAQNGTSWVQNGAFGKESGAQNGNNWIQNGGQNGGFGGEMMTEMVEVSNDDLLEAIEQLSMLSKGRGRGEEVNGCEIFENQPSKTKNADKENRRKHLDFLQNEKSHILANMEVLKRNVADIEAQEEEINRELELEKALLTAETESESLKMSQDELEKAKIQSQINDLEKEMSNSNSTQAHLHNEAKQRVENAQQICTQLEEKLANCGNQNMADELAAKLSAQQDVLETERKAFEDLEFHHLEEEASKLATREELQRYLSEISARIESRKNTLSHLELQRQEIQSSATKEAKSLEQQKLAHMRRLEEGRNRLRTIEDELHNTLYDSCENANEKRSSSREDLDRISKLTNESPIVNNHESFGPKAVESFKEIERNRQLHLAIQGRQVISEERRKVEELKRRVQAEVRSQWEERKMNCASFNSIESGEESSSYSTGPTESGSGNSDGAENANSDKLSPSKLSEFTSPSPGPSNNSYTLLQSDNIRDERRVSSGAERFGGSCGGGTNETGSRPLSQTSSEMDTYGSMQPIKYREKAKLQNLQRPLTRYLPIKSESLDLREFIEAAGHQLSLINDVEVDKTSCRGYLSKMSKKFHHWNKRWFVFDRKRKTLSYYGDSSNRKPRGIIYFQSIEYVYVDHMNSVKSPQPTLTFIVKTSSRLYHLMAPSPEAMRVWVDVVFTGAEGYHEFDHGT